MAKVNFIESTPRLARILAGENVTVVHGNFDTASFNTNTRVLELPVFNDRLDDKDVYTLFVSHEVGHALFTPTTWRHDMDTNIPGVPFQIVNIVEDIRIEKMIRRKYSGLYKTYITGYSNLWNWDFFGVKNYDISKIGFLNRLNIHAKAGATVDVPFNDKEQKLVDLAMSVETWEEVLEVSKLLSKFADDEDSKSGMSNEGSESGAADENNVQPEADGKNDTQAGSEADKKSPPADMQRASDTSTDKNFRDQEETMIERKGTRVIRYTERYLKAMFKDDMKLTMNAGFYYREFRKSTKAYVNAMVAQFNARYQAQKMMKVGESKSGTIDPVMLAQYQFNEDIFKRYSIDPNEKNHGVMMFLDNSGSMSGHRIKYIALQAAIMAEFCRKVDIPFVVYGWTNSDDHLLPPQDEYHNNGDSPKITKWVDSTMPTAKYKDAIGTMYAIFKDKHSINLMYTPLVEAKVGCAWAAAKFKTKHQIDKLHTVILTDGGCNGGLGTVTGSVCNGQATRYLIEIPGLPKITLTDNVGHDLWAMDKVIKTVSHTHIHFNAAANGNVITVTDNDESVVHCYDRTYHIGNEFQIQAIKNDITERDTHVYKKVKKMSAMIGKFVA